MSDPATPSAAQDTPASMEAPLPADALEQAWTAYRRAPENRQAKQVLVRMLRQNSHLAAAESAAEIGRLIRDPDIDPRHLSRAGWRAWLKLPGNSDAPTTDDAWAVLSIRLERDETALALLEESQVDDRAAEKLFTRLRRWLVLAARGPEYPRLVEALGRQAALNGGAWPSDDAERAAAAVEPALTRLYRPGSGAGEGGPQPNDFADDVTNAVARQYERWPYPAWTRVGRPGSKTLADLRASLHAVAAPDEPGPARILVAGCGTGGEAANMALSFPGVAVTAIDLSAASLDYARRRCAAAGIPPIRFEQLDLCAVAELGERYDLVTCCGVLHHLANPEGGWAALAGVLKPGGVMRIMVYSRLGRLAVTAARQLLRDFDLRTTDDDEVRRIRAWLLERTHIEVINRVTGSSDFSSLAGTRDLICHPHEDPFDVPRIERIVERLRLDLLRIDPLTPLGERSYAKFAPDDPLRRDFRAWKTIEFQDPQLFGSRYDFWCGKPAEAAAT